MNAKDYTLLKYVESLLEKNNITVYSDLPYQLVDALKAWKKMWKEKKREEEEEHYKRYNFNTEV